MELTENEKEMLRYAIHEYENNHFMEMDEDDQKTANKLLLKF